MQTITDRPTEDEIDLLDRELSAFNIAETGYRDFKKLAVLRRDSAGQLVAGLSGYSWGGVCKVQLLWVEASLRSGGVGRRLLSAAEEEAHIRGCSKVVLSTHSFQAPDFYRRSGYVEIGRGEGNPRGFETVYFEKELRPAA